MVITSSVGQFKGGVCLADGGLNLLPVNLELLSLLQLLHVEGHNQTNEQIRQLAKCDDLHRE